MAYKVEVGQVIHITRYSPTGGEAALPTDAYGIIRTPMGDFTWLTAGPDDLPQGGPGYLGSRYRWSSVAERDWPDEVRRNMALLAMGLLIADDTTKGGDDGLPK